MTGIGIGRRAATLAGLATGCALILAAPSALAANLDVNVKGDPAPNGCTPAHCSLREAIIRSNSTGADDRIELRRGTYNLSRPGVDDTAAAGDLDVITGSGRLTITGVGAGETAIDGNDVDRVFDVLAGAGLTLGRLGVRDGSSVDGGGAIYNAGALAVSNAIFASNVSALQGGAIENQSAGTMVVRRTRLMGNRAADRGGAIYNQNEAVARLSLIRVSGNDTGEGGDGGGVYNQNEARMTIARSTISGNRTVGDFARGGGIFNQNDARLTIKGSTISGNRAPGDNGGGIFTQNNAVLNITNSTISGNEAGNGGGIYANNFTKTLIRFSTITRNSATAEGGGVFDDTSTVNPAIPPPYLAFEGTIVAGNSAPGASDNCLVDDPVHFESLGHNLENTNTCLFDRGSDKRNANARLARLARNGGPTKTHALRRSSDAVDAGGTRRQGCPRRDQRGVRRPQGRRCDIGAYELKR